MNETRRRWIAALTMAAVTLAPMVLTMGQSRWGGGGGGYRPPAYTPPPPVYRPPPSSGGSSWQNNRSTSNYGGGYSGNRSSGYGGGSSSVSSRYRVESPYASAGRTSSGSGGGYRNTGGGSGARTSSGNAAGGQTPRLSPKPMGGGAGSPMRPGTPNAGRPGGNTLGEAKAGLLGSSSLRAPAMAMRPAATKITATPKPAGSVPTKSQVALDRIRAASAKRVTAAQANAKQQAAKVQKENAKRRAWLIRQRAREVLWMKNRQARLHAQRGPRLEWDHAKNYVKGEYENKQADGEQLLYRFHGTYNPTDDRNPVIDPTTGKPKARQLNWTTSKAYTSEKELRKDLAILRKWGVKITHMDTLRPAKGTWYSEGKAAEQFEDDEHEPGGGHQIAIDVHNSPRSMVLKTDELPASFFDDR